MLKRRLTGFHKLCNWGMVIYLLIERANEIRPLQSNLRLKIARFFGELTNFTCKQGQTNETKMNPAYIASFNVAGKRSVP